MNSTNALTGTSKSNTPSFAVQIQSLIKSYEEEANSTTSSQRLNADTLARIKEIVGHIVEHEERFDELLDQAKTITDLEFSLSPGQVAYLKILITSKKLKDLKSSMSPEQIKDLERSASLKKIKDLKVSTSLEQVNDLRSSMSLAETILKRRRIHAVAPLLVARTHFDFVEPHPVILSEAQRIERLYDKKTWVEKVLLEEIRANKKKREELDKQLQDLVKDATQNFSNNLA